MKKIIVTSPKYEGQVEATYGNNGLLSVLDFSGAEMPDVILKHFKAAVPVTFEGLPGNLSGSATIINAEVKITFEMFYENDYPYKRNRYKAEKYWSKVNETDRIDAYVSLKEYTKYCVRNQHWYTPMAADRYLRERAWETDWSKI